MDALEAIWGLLHLLLAGSLLAFGLYCCYIKSVHLRYDHIPGAPRASFFFGHLPFIWRKVQNKELVYDLFLQWADQYGPIVRLNAYHRISLLILSPEGVKEFLMSPDCPKDELLSKRLFNMFGVRFLGNGLISTHDYDHWRKQRRIMDPAFNRNYLVGLMGTFNDKAEELMKVLEERADGETAVNMSSLFKRVTLDIIGKAGFGMELNTLHNDQTPFPQAAANVMKGLSMNRLPLFRYLPWNRKVVKEIQESVKLLRHTAKECIDQRHKAMKNDEQFPLDILTQILKNVAAEGEYDIENMVDNFVSFFVAGHETTANQLSFTLMELLQHPEIVMRLQAELDESIGVKRDVAYEDLGKLKYLSQVLKESLRLYPPAPGTIRQSKKKACVEGITIPENTSLFFNMYVMGRLEKLFPNALVFDPDRFGEDKPRPYFSFLPFVVGPRSCIGQVFSQMEAKVVMAKLLQRFEFQMVPPQSFKVFDSATLRPLDDIVCQVKLRQQFG